MLFRDWWRARLSWVDAGNYYGSTADRSTDWWSFAVFAEEPGRPPGRTEIFEYFRTRLPLLGALSRRIVDAPGKLDHPYWVRTAISVEDLVSVHEWRWRDFDEWLDRAAEFGAHGVDARRCPWRIHVFPGVPAPDRPGSGTGSGTTTVIAIQASHAMLVGASVPPLFDVLFGSRARPLRVDGLPPCARRPHPVEAAVHGVIRSAVRVIPATVGLTVARVSLRKRRRAAGVATTATPPGEPGVDRCIRIIYPDLGAGGAENRTVTARGLTAVSFALERYYDEYPERRPERPASAAVPVALGAGAESLGVNRVAGALVDLNFGIPGVGERLTAIAETLNRERARVSSPESLGTLARNRREAYPFQRRTMRLLDESLASGVIPGVGSVVSSVNCGDHAEWSVPWGELRFVAGVQALAPGAEFVHTFVRVGDVFAVTVMGRRRAGEPGGAEHVERYVELLEGAFADMAQDSRSGAGAPRRG